MSNRKIRAVKPSQVKTQAPKLGKIVPTTNQPTAAQKDAILDRADKSVPVATTSPTAPAAKKRGRPSKASQAAPQPAPAGSNGKHPQTLAAVVASPSSLSMVITGHYSGEVPSLVEAQKQYRRLSNGAAAALPDAAVYTNGTQTFTRVVLSCHL